MSGAILCYSEAAFAPRTFPLFSWRTRNLSATSQQWSFWLYTKHFMDMFQRFWIRRPSTFGKYSVFTPYGGFPLITLLLGMLHCLFFQAWKAIDSLTYVLNFFLSDFYLILSFKFKIGLSLGLSCLLLSIFIIVLTIVIIKTILRLF